MAALETKESSGGGRVLFITYHFPPSPAVGGMRVANFAKHLPAFGWTPHVVTIDEQHIQDPDRERLKDLENVSIVRAGQWPTLLDAYTGMKETLRRLFSTEPRSAETRSGVAGTSGTGAHPRESVSRRIKRYFISIFLTLPDTERGWIGPAVLRSVREIREKKIDCIMTSCPPYSVHIIGLLVKWITGVRWVADFRDPWMVGATKILPTCDLSNRIESWLEKRVVENSDLVIFNAKRMRDEYQKIYRSVLERKLVHLPNGIEPSIYAEVAPLPKYKKFTLSYTGILYVDRSPEPIFEAIRQLHTEGKINLDAVVVKLVGHCARIGDRPIGPVISSYGLDAVVEILDPVPYFEALEIIRRSHIALLFAPNQPFQLPGKVYDYIGVGARILAITEDGETADFIKTARCGRAFLSSDILGIKDFILEETADPRQADIDYSEVISAYSARRITERLVSLMKKPGAREAQIPTGKQETRT